MSHRIDLERGISRKYKKTTSRNNTLEITLLFNKVSQTALMSMVFFFVPIEFQSLGTNIQVATTVASSINKTKLRGFDGNSPNNNPQNLFDYRIITAVRDINVDTMRTHAT